MPTFDRDTVAFFFELPPEPLRHEALEEFLNFSRRQLETEVFVTIFGYEPSIVRIGANLKTPDESIESVRQLFSKYGIAFDMKRSEELRERAEKPDRAAELARRIKDAMMKGKISEKDVSEFLESHNI